MKVLFTLLIMLSASSLLGDVTSGPVFEHETANVRPSWSGAWYNPDQSGHGISVEVLDDEHTVFFWYTYDLDGNPFWLTARGVNSVVHWSDLGFPVIQVEATAYYHEGMIFNEFDPATRNRQEWGTIILDFIYWECNSAYMEWYPTMEGFSQGSADLVKLTSLYDLDCVEFQGIEGAWEVQFGYDAELKYQAEIVIAPVPEFPGQNVISFEFLDETDCLWSGELEGFGPYVEADWSNQCGANAVEHSGSGTLYFEHKLCNSESECARKDEVMIFKDGEEFLIFSR